MYTTWTEELDEKLLELMRKHEARKNHDLSWVDDSNHPLWIDLGEKLGCRPEEARVRWFEVIKQRRARNLGKHTQPWRRGQYKK